MTGLACGAVWALAGMLRGVLRTSVPAVSTATRERIWWSPSRAFSVHDLRCWRFANSPYGRRYAGVTERVQGNITGL
ncbi:hypothetical protein [Herbidospora cretacea]|uniref:hypothetical protein n=1 Tax=Herbidospora cretacea TaxID=28444 RepID=UPI0034E2C7C1